MQENPDPAPCWTDPFVCGFDLLALSLLVGAILFPLLVLLPAVRDVLAPTTADDLSVTFAVAPGKLGVNDFGVRVLDDQGQTRTAGFTRRRMPTRTDTAGNSLCGRRRREEKYWVVTAPLVFVANEEEYS